MGEYLPLPLSGHADHVDLGTGGASETEEQRDRVFGIAPAPLGLKARGPEVSIEFRRGAHISQEVNILGRARRPPGSDRQTPDQSVRNSSLVEERGETGQRIFELPGLCHGRRWSFADSRSLQAKEERTRARDRRSPGSMA